MAIFDTGYEDWLGVYSLICEGAVCAHHLVHVRLERADTHRINRVDIALDTHIVDEVGNSLRLLGLLHNPRRVVVATKG